MVCYVVLDLVFMDWLVTLWAFLDIPFAEGFMELEVVGFNHFVAEL